MAYSIQQENGFVEVKVSGKTSIWEVLLIVRDLHRNDPQKKISDLWCFAGECVIPFVAFPTIVLSILRLLPSSKSMSRTALVMADEIQMAEAAMYLREAQLFPFEIKAFLSKDQAIEWLKAGATPDATPPSSKPAE